jgi:hypothetical protein
MLPGDQKDLPGHVQCLVLAMGQDADQNIGWRTRVGLHLHYVRAGVSGDPTHPDNIVYDITQQDR